MNFLEEFSTHEQYKKSAKPSAVKICPKSAENSV